MTLQLVVRSFAHHTFTDRLSRELQAYVRSEWQGDATWIRHEPSRMARRGGFRRWLASLRPAATSRSPAVKVSEARESSLPARPVELVEPCTHADAEELGLSGAVVFLRCLLCGVVLVVDRGREWSLGS